MAEFIVFKCKKCGNEFELMQGALKSSAHLSERKIGKIDEKAGSDFAKKVWQHSTRCMGDLQKTKEGFAD